MADRWPSPRALALSLFAGGLGALAILAATPAAVGLPPVATLGLVERIVVLSAAIFLVPILLLGTISPQVDPLGVTDLGRAGRVAGRDLRLVDRRRDPRHVRDRLVPDPAASASSPLVFAAGLGLVALALVVGRVWRRPVALAGALAVDGSAGRRAAAHAARSTRAARARPTTSASAWSTSDPSRTAGRSASWCSTSWSTRTSSSATRATSATRTSRSRPSSPG